MAKDKHHTTTKRYLKKGGGKRDHHKNKPKKFETESERTAYFEQKQAEKLEKQQKEIAKLDKKIEKMVPPRGINPFASKTTKKKKKKQEQGVYEMGVKFSDLPISKRTASALAHANFKEMTPIQHASIIHALAKRDILGAAKTGSGKTLAFAIPVIENLYRNHWERDDGLGALILSPSRELALQIFEVLKVVGKHHRLSAGIIVGGRKYIEEEAKYIPRMNILVATPGRLLQHLQNAYGFDCSVLQMLVLDEADRLLADGFQKDIKAILNYLPTSRQTMLFSATQTKSVKQLATLSLSRQTTEYISVTDIHGAESNTKEEDEQFHVSMPRQLKQYYIKLELHDKLNMLHALLKADPKQKVIVFVSTTKQASFCYHVFKKLPLMMKTAVLRGRMSQNHRVKEQELFTNTNQSIILFATNVAARGLDFPGVDTVIQLDVPDSIETYVHRVGRTARYQSSGKSYIFVTPEEEKAFVEAWQSSKLPKLKEKKLKTELIDMKHAIGSIVSADIKVQYEAMKYYETYLRYIEHGCSALGHAISASHYTDDALNKFSTSLGLFERPNANLERPIGFEHAKNTSIEQQADESEEEYIQRLLYGKKKASKKEFVAKTLTRGVAFQFQDAYQKLVGGLDKDDDDTFFETIPTEDSMDDDLEEDHNEGPINYFEEIVKEKEDETQALDQSYLDNLRQELTESDARDKSLKKKLLKKQRELFERDQLSSRLQSQYTRKMVEDSIQQNDDEQKVSRKRKRASINDTQQALLQQPDSPKKAKTTHVVDDEALALALIEQGLS